MPGAPDLAGLITAEAQLQGVDPAVPLAIAHLESSMDPSRNSPLGPSYGRGLMGLSDAAASDMGVDPTTLEGNIAGGVGYYKRQLDRFGDPLVAAAAYNAGPEKIARAGGKIPAGPGWDGVRKYAMAATGAQGDGADIFADDAPAAATQGDGADIFADPPASADPGAPGPQVKPKTNTEMRAITDLTPAQREGFYTLYRGGLYDDSKPNGDARNPYFLQPGATADQLKPGDYYFGTDPEQGQKAAKLMRVPGGADEGKNSFGDGLYAGAGDVVNSLFGLLPGHDRSDIWNSNKAQQAIYEASHVGDRVAQGGRLLGQVFGSAPLLAGGEGLAVTGADAAPGALRFLLGDEGALGAAAERIPQMLSPAKRFMLGEAGDLAPGAGGVALRTASRFARGAIEGATGAAATKESDDAPLGEQMAGGAIGGGILRAGMPGLGAQLARLGGTVSEGTRNLSALAIQKYGIPLRTTQILGVGSRDAAYRDSEMLGKDLTGYRANNEEQERAFTRAISRTFGSDSESLTPPVLLAARKNIGDGMNAVTSHLNVPDTTALAAQLDDMATRAQSTVGDNEAAPIARLAAQVKTAFKGGQLSGTAYQALTNKGGLLDDAIESGNPTIRQYALRMREAVDQAAEAALPPELQGEFSRLRGQYKNLMTIAPLVTKANADGHVSPALLRGRIIQSFKSAPFYGAGDLGELAQIGQTFMKEPPNSGTAKRLMIQMGGHGAVGAIPAAAIAFAHEPHAVIGGAAAAALGLAHQLATEMTSGFAGRSSRASGALAGLPPKSPALSNLLTLLANHTGHAQVQAGGRAGQAAGGAIGLINPPQYVVPQIPQQK